MKTHSEIIVFLIIPKTKQERVIELNAVLHREDVISAKWLNSYELKVLFKGE